MPWLCWLSPASHPRDSGSIPCQSMWDLWWTKWHWDRFFFLRVLHFSRVSIIPPMFHAHLHQILVLSEGRSGETWGNFKPMLSQILGERWAEKNFHCFCHERFLLVIIAIFLRIPAFNSGGLRFESRSLDRFNWLVLIPGFRERVYGLPNLLPVSYLTYCLAVYVEVPSSTTWL